MCIRDSPLRLCSCSGSERAPESGSASNGDLDSKRRQDTDLTSGGLIGLETSYKSLEAQGCDFRYRMAGPSEMTLT